jgi:hypothetical protein
MVDEKKEESGEEGKKEEKKTESKDATEDKDVRDASKKEGAPEGNLTMVDEAKKAAKELRKANQEKKELLDREEKLQAEKELGGKSGMSAPVKPKKLTDEEYSEAVDRGEVNPLEEDGIKL